MGSGGFPSQKNFVTEIEFGKCMSCLQLLHHHVNVIDQDVNAPMKQLFGFQRVELNPKENTTLIFDAGVETFMTVDKGVYITLGFVLKLVMFIYLQGNKILKPGSYTVNIEDLSLKVYKCSIENV